MDREIIILREVSQIDNYIIYMWNLKSTNELIYKTKTHRHREETYGYQRGSWGGRGG